MIRLIGKATKINILTPSKTKLPRSYMGKLFKKLSMISTKKEIRK